MMKRLGLFSVFIAVIAIAFALSHQNSPLVHTNPYLSPIISHPVVASVISRIEKTLSVIPQFNKQSQPKIDKCSCGNVVDPTEKAACQLQGIVPDCCCSYAAVERMNKDSMLPTLKQLVQTPFFQYFKTDLYCECPLWPDDGMCSLRDCSVCECEPEEIPAPWREAEERAKKSNGDDISESCDGLQRESDIDRTIQPHIKAKLMSVSDWKGYRNPWMPDDDSTNGKSVEYSYINLLRNPERYTGYKGEHANRVWMAIYQQPCFENITAPGTEAERRVFYKLISGMHSSISAHIVGDYLLDEAKGKWGPNLEMFKWRLGNPQVKDRVENLYFTYLFVLRAVMKAGPLLQHVDFDTGSPQEDAKTRELVRSLVDNSALKHSCPIPFDEGRLWKGDDADLLKKDLQIAFKNITRIMDCVGCEKCKMWGKLQLLGIATSLKILFSSEDCTGSSPITTTPNGLVLERNEVIALFNLLERLAMSVEVVRDLSLQLTNTKDHPQGLGAIQDLIKEKLSQGLVS